MRSYSLLYTVLLFALVSSVQLQSDAINLQASSYKIAPVIGVMTMPVHIKSVDADGWLHFADSSDPEYEKYSEYMMLNSYAKYLELAGAQVVPILHDTPKEKLITLLDKINGVLFTGGGLDLVHPETGEYHIYTKTSDVIFQYAIEKTDQGDPFPLIGICQGFQLLNILRSEDKFVLKKCPSDFKNDTLNPFIDNYENSRWLSSIAENAEWTFSHSKIVLNIHDWGIFLADYLFNRPELANFYRILTYEEDDNRRLYVSSVEAYDYPIYAVQYHPERTYFRYSTKYHNYPRDNEARTLCEDLIFFFVDECRKSTHSFDNYTEYLRHINDCRTRTWGHVESTGEYVEPVLIDKQCYGY